MRTSPVPDAPLLGPVALTLLVLCVGGTLYVLLPREDGAVEPEFVDAVGLFYLRAQLERQPEDTRARLRLARAMRHISQMEEALQVLTPLVGREDPIGEEARTLAMELRLSLWRQLRPEDPRRVVGRQELTEALRGYLRRASPAEQERWGSVVLEVGGPGLLAELSGTSKASPVLIAEAARQRSPSVDPLEAASVLFESAAQERDRQRSDSTLARALELLRGVKDSTAVLALLERTVPVFRARAHFLDRAVSIAREHSALDLARRWQELRVALTPEDVASLRLQLELALAAGDARDALAPARRLARLLDTAKAHQQVATIADWSGALEISLDEWMWLARHEGRPEQLERAMTLGRMLWNLPAQVELLMLQAMRGELSSADRANLVRLREELGEPEVAERYLVGYLQTHPGDEAALELLAGLRERQRDLTGALEAWNTLALRAGPSPAMGVHQATLLWRLERPREALRALTAVQSMAGPKDKEFWTLLGRIAWALDEDAAALTALRVLHAEDPREPEVARQVARLLARGERPEEAVTFARELFRNAFDAEVLACALEAAIRSGSWEEGHALVEAASPFIEQYKDDSNLALLEAEILLRTGDVGPARNRYESALRIAPHSRPARLGLLEALLQQRDARTLASRMGEWKAEAAGDASYWELYAAASTELGDSRAAADWYRRLTRARPDDPFLLLSYAEALLASGDAKRARAARLQARGMLEPRAHRLAEAPAAAPAGEVQALLSYLDLLVALDGDTSADAWRPLLEGPLKEDPQAQQWLLGHALRRDDLAAARSIATRLERGGHPLASRQRLALALASSDSRAVEHLLSEEGATLSIEEQVLARRELGQERIAYLLASRAMAERSSMDLRQQHRELREALAPAIELRGGTEGHADFSAWGIGVRAHAQPGALFEGLLEAEAGVTNLRLDDAASGRPPDAREVSVETRALFGPRRRRTTLGVGLAVRDGGLLPRGYALQSLALGRDVLSSAGLQLNEPPEDQAELRFFAVRHQLSLAGEARLTDRGDLSLALSVNQYRTRAQALLGNGATGGAAVGYTLPLGVTSVRARATYDAALNSLVNDGPAWELGRAARLLPRRVMSAGAGLTLMQGDVRQASGISGPVRILADAWGGWLWPYNQPGYQLRLELGVPVLSDTQVGVEASVSHAINAGITDACFMAGLRLHQRFGP
ncbi:hypothetical protein D7V80_19410 [Corallococcus sp. CA054B]|uniref:tetratricopeptide repeat protein n=1 Tax=Corallococcus sp. CA054B TaxID=2316734 RepID=UPI000EA038A6|nr:tetratricopeptide repeat protein [Corallococcus sp. CA054B]RKG66500.1 hypothetical protein D7V80_19410 [Corallococcus sp. CA054B]